MKSLFLSPYIHSIGVLDNQYIVSTSSEIAYIDAFTLTKKNVIATPNPTQQVVLNGSRLFVSTLNQIHVYDPRTKKSMMDWSAPNTLCFSVSADQTTLATGTELVGEDAKICFWDMRQTNRPIIEFNECHSDDITQVVFHPTQPKLLLSGSTDGYIFCIKLVLFACMN